MLRHVFSCRRSSGGSRRRWSSGRSRNRSSSGSGGSHDSGGRNLTGDTNAAFTFDNLDLGEISVLQKLRDDVRSAGDGVAGGCDHQPGRPRESDPPDSWWDLEMTGDLFGALITSPCWLPLTALGDQYSTVEYFPRFPYDGVPGYLTPNEPPLRNPTRATSTPTPTGCTPTASSAACRSGSDLRGGRPAVRRRRNPGGHPRIVRSRGGS